MVDQTTGQAPVAGGDTATVQLAVEDINLSFGGIKALQGIDLSVQKGEIYSIIGPNGAGKTSLLNCISGRYNPQQGRIIFEGQEITGLKPNQRCRLGLGRTFQNLALFGHMTVLDNILVGRHHLMRNNFLTGSLYWLTGARQEELEHRRHVEDIIDFLEITHIRNSLAGTLSYGLCKRVELARAVALNPKLLLLDEPMAGMNFEEKEDIARYILDLNQEWGITIVMIEHDMGVVVDISDHVTVLNFGKPIASGEPEEVMADPFVRQAYLGDDVIQETA